MAKMKLFNSSCQADDMCIVYCKAHADMCLNSDNAVLVRLKTESGREHIVWMDANLAEQGVYHYQRAFYELQEWQEDDLSKVATRILIRPDYDVFCYNRNVYFLYTMQSKNLQIRRLRAYPTQRIVEDIERQLYKNKAPDEIFLANFYTFDKNGKNYELTCWGLSYKEGTNYVPVFDEDRHYLEEFDILHFSRDELPVGAIFKNNGYYYKVLQNADGKLELEQAKSAFLFNKNAECMVQPLKPQAKIISFDFKNKKQNGG